MSDINAENLLSAIDSIEKGKEKPVKQVKQVKQDVEVEALKAELRDQIASAGSLVEKLKATYTLQDALRANESRPTPGLTIIGSFNEPDPFNTLTKQYAVPGNHYHWSNTHPTIYDFRKSRGYKPVVNDKKENVTIGDSVLMYMPEKQYLSEVVAPKRARKTAVRKGIVDEFKNAAYENGVKVFGKIQYDDGEVIHIGEEE